MKGKIIFNNPPDALLLINVHFAACQQHHGLYPKSLYDNKIQFLSISGQFYGNGIIGKCPYIDALIIDNKQTTPGLQHHPT